MAEGQDQDQKTEAPTQKRLQEARDEGRVPLSPEIRTWFMLMGGLLVVMIVAPYMGGQVRDALIPYLAGADQLSVADGSMRRAFLDTMWHMAPSLALFCVIMIIAAVGGTMVQTGLFWSSKLLSPDWSRVSLFSGWGRLFSPRSVLEMLKGAGKIGIVAIAVYFVVRPIFTGAELLNGMEPALQLKVMYQYTLKIIATVLGVFTVIAFSDYAYARFTYFRNLRMTKQEIKEEYRQTEGDPLAKARLRQIRVERSRRRMMASVPEADVVITNPTHFAVALQYDGLKMAAPKVIAMGQDAIALKIREVAQENDVPLVENPPLARALYAACDLDDEIPAEHYQAVAQIISYVYNLKNKKR